MSWTDEEITVGTSATAIKPADPTVNVGANKAVLRTHATNTVYLGGSSVTTSSGVELDEDTVYELDLSDGAPYLISGTEHAVNVAFGRDE